jgi:hypothetical protein
VVVVAVAFGTALCHLAERAEERQKRSGYLAPEQFFETDISGTHSRSDGNFSITPATLLINFQI